MKVATGIAAQLSLLAIAAIFGFFYAWGCSAMWGLDAADPHIAIPAMQAMNDAVRNPVFASAFFGAPVILALAAATSWSIGARNAAALFGLSAVVYALGGLGVTVSVNVPLNQELAAATLPDDSEAAAQIWRDYSQPWQFWNWVRAGFSGVALLLTGASVANLGRFNALGAPRSPAADQPGPAHPAGNATRVRPQ